MTTPITRRRALQLIATAAAVGATTRSKTEAATALPRAPDGQPADAWSRTHDRVWLGGAYWANPMEDWKIADGGAECQSPGGNRSIHSLTHQITNAAKGFTMSVQLSQLEVRGKDGGAGFRLGARSELNEYRSNCFVGRGVDAGVLDGNLVLGPKSVPLANPADPKNIGLLLSGVASGSDIILTLEARAGRTATSLGKLVHTVPAASLLGNVALVSNYSPDDTQNSAKKAPKTASDGNPVTDSPTGKWRATPLRSVQPNASVLSSGRCIP